MDAAALDLFRTIDADGDGTLSPEELAAVASVLAERLPDLDVCARDQCSPGSIVVGFGSGDRFEG